MTAVWGVVPCCRVEVQEPTAKMETTGISETSEHLAEYLASHSNSNVHNNCREYVIFGKLGTPIVSVYSIMN
jgi:hypothetical protein